MSEIINKLDLKSMNISEDIQTETDKIKCGRKHFEEIGVDYNVATDITNSGI